MTFKVDLSLGQNCKEFKGIYIEAAFGIISGGKRVIKLKCLISKSSGWDRLIVFRKSLLFSILLKNNSSSVLYRISSQIFQ